MTSRVLFCTVDPHPEAVRALEAYVPQAEVIDVTGDNYAYWREIRERWTGEQDLIIIEQDIEVREDTIPVMEECKQDWCCYAYPIFRTKVRLRVGLGCIKISAAAQRKISPEAIEEGFETCAQCRGKGCWWHLDGRIAHMLKRFGFFPHVHGDITHHHDYEQGMDPDAEGRPIEWFFEEDGDTSPALVINPDLIGVQPMTDSGRSAKVLANQMAEVAERLADDSSLLTPLKGVYGSDMMPFGLPRRPAPKAYDTDKVEHGYMPTYNYIADQLGGAARVCEVGVFNGGSLATWQDLFPGGTIVGVDRDPYSFWPAGTIKVIAGQDDPGLPDMLRKHSDEWDLIVDDASHNGELTAKTFGLLWELVSPGGFYVIEDWYVGFSWYGGRCKSPEMLPVVQSLLERLTGDESDTDSVSYRYGMAIIRKKV